MPPPSPPPVLGASLGGRFDLVRELGSGSSGTVYRARLREDYGELKAGDEVAVKFLRQHLVADDKAQKRLLAEGELGRRIRHPNVAAIHGVETIDVLGLPVTYLVMEYVRGTTLRTFLQESGQPVEDLTRRIGADAANGLHALHRRGVVHRDVKPENFVLTPQGGLAIVDLGLARPFGAGGSPGGSGSGSGNSSGAIGGSVAYTAPEALRGQPAGPRADLYALGVVLFEVTAGRHPFAECKTADEMIHAHLFQAPPRPSHFRPRMSLLLEQVVLDLLQKEPDRRPRDAAEVARILQQGEASEWWRRHEQTAPALASGRRLQRMRRPAETPFFGRDHELAFLQARLDAARAGDGRTVCIRGAKGSGRGRLLDEAMAAWLQDDADLLYLGGEADRELGHGEPFAGSLLDWLLRGDDRDSPNAAARAEARAREALQLDDAAAKALAAVAMGTSAEPAEVRADRLANALLRLPRKGRVLVLRVDAAERLDTSGRLVLQRLVASAQKSHLLLLLATAPDGLPNLPAERLELAGLDEEPFLAFGRALFRDGACGDGFLLAAHQALSGIPGALLESLETLVEEGAMRGRAGDYHALAPGAEARPAPQYVARFEQRVAALPPAEREVLAAAAVLGDRCHLHELAALTSLPELSVLETLSVFRGRIVRAQAGEVSFRHRAFRKALLLSLSDAERRVLHERAAELLEGRQAPSLEVGLHRSRALDHEGSVRPLLAGLEELVRSGSRRTALRIAARLRVHFERLPHDAEHDRLRLRFLLLSGRARANAGQQEQANALFTASRRLAETLGDATAAAEARTGLAEEALGAGRLDDAQSLLTTVHEALGAADGPAGAVAAARAHALHGRILFHLGRSADALAHVQDALAQLPDGEDDLRTHFTIDRARVEALRHRFGEATKTLQRAAGERGARHMPRVRLRLHLYRGELRAVLGDDECVQDLRLAADEAERLALPQYGARAWLALGERSFFRGRDDDARAAFATARALAEQANDRLAAAAARIHQLRLGADDVSADSGSALEVGPALALPALAASFHATRSFLAGRKGDVPAARAAAGDALALVRSADLPLPLHLRVLAAADRPASARALVRAVGERIQDRGARRRFLAEWAQGARI